MDMGIVTVQVTQARLETVGSLLENEEAVRAFLSERVGNPQLKGHVEARHSKGTREACAAEVMKGSATTRDQAIDSIKPVPASAGNLQYAPGLQAQAGKPGEQRHEETSIPPIEGDVQENALPVRTDGRFHGIGRGLLRRGLVRRSRLGEISQLRHHFLDEPGIFFRHANGTADLPGGCGRDDMLFCDFGHDGHAGSVSQGSLPGNPAEAIVHRERGSPVSPTRSARAS